MARTKISEFSATPSDNTDIDGIDIAEGCAPSGINNAIRELMAQLKDMQTGASGDTFTLTTVNSTTVDTTNLEATNLKAKDGTAAGSIANSTGVVTLGSSVLTTTDINGGTVDGTTIGATTPSTVVATQVDITAQGDLRLQDTTGGQYVALQAPGTIATSYTLTLPVDDGTAGQALITDGSGVLSWSTAASGDVYGPASATDNAVARYDGTTGKIIQNSAVTIGDDGATVIAANSSSDGLRITQIGTGNALLVEDAANPDSTPFVVNASGQLGIGIIGAGIPGGAGLYMVSDGTAYYDTLLSRSGDNAGAMSLDFRKTRGTVAAPTVVSNGDTLANMFFRGYDGAGNIQAASIVAAVDGTPGTNDMPGRLVFSTTADGASSPTERMRIDNQGQVGIGGASLTGYTLRLNKAVTGSTFAGSQIVDATIQSGVTGGGYSYISRSTTAAAAFTLSNLYHFYSNPQTFGAGSAVTSQYGFHAESSLTGATNNYGFYGNIASGTGRWNLYMAGTAANYLEGATTVNSTIGVKTTASAEYNILVGGNLTGGVNSGGLRFQSQIQSDVTSNARGIMSIPSTAAASFTIGNLEHFFAGQGSLGAGSAISNQYGYRAASSLTGATNNYGFYGDIASGTGRWNFYAAGTADNYFAGNVGIGGAPSTLLHVNNASAKIRIGVDASSQYTDIYRDNATGFTVYNAAQAATFRGHVWQLGGSEAMRIASTGTISLGAAPGSESLRVTPVASAVNYFELLGAATGGTPALYVSGSDANISSVITSKGTGNVQLRTSSGSVIGLVVAHTASAVNYLQVTGAATGQGALLQSAGSDTNIAMVLGSKGSGAIFLATSRDTGFFAQFAAVHTASAVNYVVVTGSATGNSVAVGAQGSDTNIDIALTPKGTGNIKFGTLTANADAPITGYITIKDSAGNLRKLAVIA